MYNPEGEGVYQYRYTYGPEASVEFSVVWPQLEQWIQVRFEKTQLHQEVNAAGQPFGKPLQIPRLIRFMVLGYENTHVIAVSANPVMGGPPDVHPSGKLTGLMSGAFGTYRRIATSTVPITSLQATADSGENITLIYTDQSGHTVKLKLNANRELLP
jgi:hypothetical protein